MESHAKTVVLSRTVLQAVVVLVTLGVTVPALAQSSHTWVSATGNDSNDCSRSSPCRTLPRAIDVTNTGGEVTALDPANYAAGAMVRFDKAITINGRGVAIIASTEETLAQVAAPSSDDVVLDGLIFDGIDTPSGSDALVVVRAKSVTVRNSTFRNMPGQGRGINFAPTVTNRVVIENCSITNTGMGVQYSHATLGATIFLLSTTIDRSRLASTRVVGNNTVRLFVKGSTLIGSPIAFWTDSGSTAQIISLGDNFIRGSGDPTQTDPLK